MDKSGVVKKERQQPVKFHQPGIRWRYSDGAVLEIGRDGAARRPEPRVRMSKKARRRARQDKKNGKKGETS